MRYKSYTFRLNKHFLVYVCVLVVSGIMWWLYFNYNNEASIELETEKENMKLLFGFSIIATIVTVRHFLQVQWGFF